MRCLLLCRLGARRVLCAGLASLVGRSTWLEGSPLCGPRLPTGRVPAGCVALSAGLALLARRLCRAAAACGWVWALLVLSALLGCSAELLCLAAALLGCWLGVVELCCAAAV